MYYYGDGVEQNYKEAIKYYRMAANQGDIDAIYNLAQMYQHGEGVEKDCKEAMYYYKFAADQGDIDAKYNLEDIYQDRDGQGKHHRATRYYKVAIGHRDWRLHSNAGFIYLTRPESLSMYWDREKISKNYGQALRYFSIESVHSIMEELKRLEASQNTSQFNKYHNGKAQKEKEAQKYYNLAEQLYKEKSISANCAEAIRYYRMAADQGASGIHSIIGHMYEEGKGTAKNKEEAIKYYRLAVTQGDKDAKKRLEELCPAESDVNKNADSEKTQGVDRFRMLLKEASMYRKGKSVEKDYKVALDYYYQGFEECRRDLDSSWERARKTMYQKLKE